MTMTLPTMAVIILACVALYAIAEDLTVRWHKRWYRKHGRRGRVDQ